MARPDQTLVEQVLGAWRPRDRDGNVRGHPAYYDLDAEGREHAFEEAARLRRLEAAGDPEGLSTTGRAVLARIRRVQGAP